MRIVVYAFGRFNPTSVGHKRLAEAIQKRCNAERMQNVGAKVDGFMLMSPKDNRSGAEAKKNPLTPQSKEKWAKEIIKVPGVMVTLSHVGGNAVECAATYAKSYNKIVYVHGSDTGQMQLAKAVAGDVMKLGKIYDSEILQRTGNNTSELGISASLLRDFVMKGKMVEFKKAYPGLPAAKAEELFHELALVLYK